MAESLSSPQCDHISKTDDDQNNSNSIEKFNERYEETLPKLPKAKGWMTDHLVQYQGLWITPTLGLKTVLWIQDLFKPRPTDIFLSAFPKSGTTWLKALLFATVNRSRCGSSDHPLLTAGPHDCLTYLETYADGNDRSLQELDGLPSPRLLATHVPFNLLPKSMTDEQSCRFVYICRDPKDVFVSKWLFMRKLTPKQLPPLSLEEAFELFCQGISHFGPYWDHVLAYWKASLERPEKVLFLKYEDLKKEPFGVVKRLGEFTGYPFSLEEETRGGVQEIVKLCSFENLSSLEVNKTRTVKISRDVTIDNRDFFRKGKVGDGKNYLTEEMIQRLNAITCEKLQGSGLVLGN